MALEEKYHVKTMKGLEGLLARELHDLGAERVETLNRGVSFMGSRSMMYKVNLASRLALRVLLPVARFRSWNEDKLYQRVKEVDWSAYLDPKMTFAVDTVVHSKHFRHSHYVALKVKDAIADQFRERTHLRPSVNLENPDLRIHVHVSEDRVTLSLDSSGSSLHRRGYRLGNFDAPLNEVLAAGMIMLSGWKGDRPFLDPMCGSGTLAIEAALMAANIPPGIFRRGFGFETWKDFDRELMDHVARSLEGEREVKVPIIARDADPEAVALTRRQIRKMELQSIIQVEQLDFAETDEMGGMHIVTNPPYGERIKSDDIEALYSMIGSTLKHRFPGSDAWILSASTQGLKKVGLKPDSRTKLFNGPLECSYVNYKTFRGNWKDYKTGANC
jgi:putative N6-adenine-specific DNA methylase